MSEKTNYIEVEEYSQDARRYEISSKNPIDPDEFSLVELANAVAQVDITKDGDTCEYETEDDNTITVKFVGTEYGDDAQINITHIQPWEWGNEK